MIYETPPDPTTADPGTADPDSFMNNSGNYAGSFNKAGSSNPNEVCYADITSWYDPDTNTTTFIDGDPNTTTWTVDGDATNTTGQPVRYFDGTAILTATDISSNFGGTPWGVTRSWTNADGYVQQNVVGTGMVIQQRPTLIQVDGNNELSLILDGHTAHFYTWNSSTSQYETQALVKGETLSYDSSHDEYVVTDAVGAQYRFYGFPSSLPDPQQGQLKSYTDAFGEVTNLTYDTDGRLSQVVRDTTENGNTVTEKFDYTYVTSSGANEGLLRTVTLSRLDDSAINWSIVRKVVYDYYTASDNTYGNPGDLKAATIKDGFNNVLSVTYYRYYTQDDIDNDQPGYVHGLKYILSPQSYGRATGALGNPQTASDNDLAPYADHYFEYDSEHRVTVENAQGTGCSVHGGMGTYQYAYEASSNADGFNSWAVKTTETLPDGNQNIAYTNYVGQVMLKVYHHPDSDGSGPDTDQKWEKFYRYDEAGHVILAANPSAVSGYDDTYADLVHYASGNAVYLRDGDGLITDYVYYDATTADSNNPVGYLQETDFQHGETGTPIKQSSKTYIAQTVGSQTIYLNASNTAYANTNGTGSQVTSYTYTFYSGTLKVESKATTTPDGATDTIVYDPFGRPTWEKDAAGYISYHEYGQKAGALIKTIDDVDTSKTGAFRDLPSGWTSLTGTRLHLVTNYQVDPLGRTIREIDPNGNITYTVYNDANHEIRVYPGWNASTQTPTGPIVIRREDWADNYDETLTSSATPAVDTNGRPTGGETISTANLLSLSRTHFNEGAQAISDDAYFSFATMTYSTAASLGTEGTHFYRTTYDYDDRGRLSRIAQPDGAITRLVRDGQDRLLSTWIGDDDTPTSGDWSPDNTAGTNMVRQVLNRYDGGGIGDGLLTRVTDALGRVTLYGYDFRGRQTSQTLPDPDGSGPLTSPVSHTAYDNLDRVVSKTDALGNQTTYAYSVNTTNGRATVTTTLPDPDGSGSGHPLTSPVSSKTYSARGLLISQTDALDNVTSYKYDGAKRLVKVTAPDPDGSGSLASPVTQYAYDRDGNLRFTTDPLGNVTQRQYDRANRLTAVIQPDPDGSGPLAAPETDYAYDVAGMQQSLTDPDGNVTSWEYDPLGRKTGETNQLSDTRYFEYDGANRLIQKIDRLGRTTQYAYNVLDQITEERWYSGTAPSLTLVRTLSYTYDDAGQLTEASDPSATYDYTYDSLGRVTSEVQTIDGLSSTIEYHSQYNADGSRTDLQALLGSTNDFHNTYAYDNLQRLTGLTQAGISGGNAVAAKRVDFSYNANSQFDTITRYADTSGSEFVANTFYGYDDLSRLTSLIHTTDSSPPTSGWGSGILAGYLYGFDVGSRITSINSYLEGSTSYSYDHTSQLTGADHSSNGPADESYSYDANGNRTMSGYSTGDNNQLSSDGTYTYTYDAEGNRLTRTNIATGYVTEYSWDWRNRLIGVTEKDDENNVLSSVSYSYDVNNQRIEKSVDSDGPGSAAAVDTFFSWQGNQIALQLNGSGAVTHRYLYGPVVDQILADESVSSPSSPGSVIWPLTDHLGTLADLATHNSSSHTTSIANHRTFDSYGNITAETNSAVDMIFAFTGRERDDETGLQYNRARYYDAHVGRWIGEDPIQFAAGDTDLARYVSNYPLGVTDPSGLQAPDDVGPGRFASFCRAGLSGAMIPGKYLTYPLRIIPWFNEHIGKPGDRTIDEGFDNYMNANDNTTRPIAEGAGAAAAAAMAIGSGMPGPRPPAGPPITPFPPAGGGGFTPNGPVWIRFGPGGTGVRIGPQGPPPPWWPPPGIPQG